MDRAKGLIISLLVVWALLEGLLWGYRILRETARDKRPPDAYVYDVKKSLPEEEIRESWSEIRTLPVPFEAPRGLAVDRAGRFHLVGDRALIVLGADGKERSRIALAAPPTCLALGDDGSRYVGFRDHIEVFSPTGATRRVWASLGENAWLTSLAAGGNNLYAADFGNRIVWRFDRQGTLTGRIGGRDRSRGILSFVLPSPHFDVAASADRVWAVNPGRHYISEFTPEGIQKRTWGRASLRVTGFCGCCNPTDLARFPDGRFATAEKGLPRIKIYAPDGAFLELVAGTERFDEDTAGMDLAVGPDGTLCVLDPKRKQIRIFAPQSESS